MDMTVDTTGVAVGSIGAAVEAEAEAGRVMEEPGADDALVARRQRQRQTCLHIKTHENIVNEVEY